VLQREKESYQGMPSQLAEKLKNVCIAVEERPFQGLP
jgi:predicted Zn-dependent protease with MMP-like domain